MTGDTESWPLAAFGVVFFVDGTFEGLYGYVAGRKGT